MMKVLGKRLVEVKVYVNRAASYLAMLNTGMLLLLVIAKFKDFGYDIRLETWGIPIYIATIILFIGVGWLDIKLGLMQYEITVGNKVNAELVKIQSTVDEIKRKLEETRDG